MKKLLIVSMFASSLYACGGGGTAAKTDSTTTAPAPAAKDALSDNPDYQKGLALVGKNDCLTCHKIDETLTGPAYREVANKYANSDTTINNLAGKIIAGGKGNFGQIPMTPHPTVSLEDAKAMAKYVMLLKNK